MLLIGSSGHRELLPNRGRSCGHQDSSFLPSAFLDTAQLSRTTGGDYRQDTVGHKQVDWSQWYVVELTGSQVVARRRRLS